MILKKSKIFFLLYFQLLFFIFLTFTNLTVQATILQEELDPSRYCEGTVHDEHTAPILRLQNTVGRVRHSLSVGGICYSLGIFWPLEYESK